MRKHVKLFNVIAPVYGWFFNKQKKRYLRVYRSLEATLDLHEHKSVLDLGCGTGALASMFADQGFTVHGVDASNKMLNIAKRKTTHQAIQFHEHDILEALPFDDHAFDIVIASYVAHGLSRHERHAFYQTMARLAKHLVIIHDYKKNKNPFIALIEWLERGDYFNFVKQVPAELKPLCKNSENSQALVYELNNHAAWYVCRQRD